MGRCGIHISASHDNEFNQVRTTYRLASTAGKTVSFSLKKMLRGYRVKHDAGTVLLHLYAGALARRLGATAAAIPIPALYIAVYSKQTLPSTPPQPPPPTLRSLRTHPPSPPPRFSTKRKQYQKTESAYSPSSTLPPRSQTWPRGTTPRRPTRF